jgi:hypothetical protein
MLGETLMYKTAKACLVNTRLPIYFGNFAIAMLIALTATAAIAQTTTGGATLVGAITDSSGAVLPGAKVIVINIETLFRSETQTSPEGTYYVPYLNPGSYRITVEASGFRSHVREGVVLRTGETPRLDIALEVGSTTEAITVSGAVSLLATETAASGQILEGKTIVNLPSPQGRIARLIYYYPGTIGSAGTHILGQRQRAIGFSLDGMSGKTPGTNTYGDTDQMVQTSSEAIQEVKVSTSGMSAEVGHSAGGGMSVVFKSGTNALHGSFDERLIQSKLVQRDYLQAARDTTPTMYDWFDGAIGGPIVLPKLYNGRNRTFFLATFGAFLQSGGQPTAFRNVPTDAMYNGDFSFGGQGLPIYNPFTTRQDATGKWIRDPFPGNQIPANLFDPVAKNFLAKNPFTKANAPGFTSRTAQEQNLILLEPKIVHRLHWDGKIDHQFSSNHKIFGRYSHMDATQYYRGAFRGELAWPLIDPNQQPTPVNNINGVLSDTYVFGPSRFNEFRLGYNRRTFSVISLSYGQDWAKQLGMPNVSALTFPVFNLGLTSGTSGYGMGSVGRAYQAGEDISLQDNFTQIIGKHTLKMGYELTRTRYNSAVETQPSGTYNFGGTELPFTPNTGNTFASFLLGTVNSAVFTQDFGTWLPRWWQHAMYVQDDWKAARGLTLSLGLRWSYESPFQTKYGQQSQFDPTVIDSLTGKLGAITHPKGALAKKDLNNFQPRLGLAWNFRPKWVFRSSFGMMTQDLTVNDINQNFGEYTGTANVQAPSGDPRHVFRLSEGPPTTRYAVQSGGSVPFIGSNYSARVAERYDPNMRMPYIMNWSAGFQYEFARNWLVEAIYQGTAGVGLLNNWDMNSIPLDISRDPVALNRIFQDLQSYKPYPQFGAINFYSNFGHNTYHSSTLRVEKRYSAGLTLLGLYTLAKAIDENDADGAATGITYYNRRLEKGRAGYDIRHRYMSLLTYEFPLGKGRRWLNRGGVLNQAVGGWDVIWPLTFQSGPPTTVTFAGSPNRYLPGASRPNALVPMEQAVVSGWNPGPNRFPTSAQNPYLLFNAFAYPAAFTPGTLGRNTFESPGMTWVQLTVAKSWSFGERFKGTLRADFNNLPFKQPQFAAPNSIYNANNPSTFGRFTSLLGPFASIGTSRPHIIIGGRVQF